MLEGAEGGVGLVGAGVGAEGGFPEVADSHREVVHPADLAGEAGGAVHRSEEGGQPDIIPLLTTRPVMEWNGCVIYLFDCC